MIEAGLCTVLRSDLLHGVHQPGDTYKIALYRAEATLTPETAAYTPDGEVDASGTYEPGGLTLEGLQIRDSGQSAGWTWRDPIWTQTTLSARGALIYNASAENRAIVVLDFGETVDSLNGPFTIDFPAREPLIQIA